MQISTEKQIKKLSINSIVRGKQPAPIAYIELSSGWCQEALKPKQINRYEIRSSATACIRAPITNPFIMNNGTNASGAKLA